MKATTITALANRIGLPRLSDGLAHRGVGRCLVRGAARRLQVQPHQQRLHQHHRAVDDDAEIDRAQRDQIGRDAARLQHDERAQQRQRNHRRHDQRGAPVTQEDDQDRDHQQRADHQVLGHRVHGMADQVAAVVDDAQAHARRQARAELGDLRLDVRDDVGRVAALGHLDDAFDHAVLFVERDHARARAVADRHLADVRHQHRCGRCWR